MIAIGKDAFCLETGFSFLSSENTDFYMKFNQIQIQEVLAKKHCILRAQW